MRIFLVIYILFGFLNNIQGQQKISLKGKVSDSGTSETLVGANVYFEGTGIGTVTDADGNYFLSGFPPGDYTLVVSYIGYDRYEEQFRFSDGSSIQKNFRLNYSGGEKLDEVVVTAQAQGQYKAINQQLSASDIRSVVSSDRLRELPDANAAESLGRLPGVSLQRSGGEGEKVIIRGLSPKYNKVMVEGIEIAATGKDDRSVSLNTISSYSLDGMEVVKSNTADMDGDFVGGAVNFKLRTASPGFQTELGMLGGYNNLKGTFNDYKFDGSVSNRFMDDRLGLFFHANFENRNRSASSRSLQTGLYGDATREGPNEVYLYQMTLSDIVRSRNRKGGTLVLDYKLDKGEIQFKNFLSSGHDQVIHYSEVLNVSNERIQLATNDVFSERLMYNNYLSYKQKFSNLSIDASISHAYSGGNNPSNLRFNFYQESALPGVSFDPHPDSIMVYSALDPKKVLVSGFSDTDSRTEHRQLESALNLEWAYTLSKQISGYIKVGGKYRHQQRYYDQSYRSANLTSGFEINLGVIEAYPEIFSGHTTDDGKYIYYSAFIDESYNAGKFFEGKYGAFPQGADVHTMHLFADYARQKYSGDPVYAAWYQDNAFENLSYDYTGKEDYYAGYLMGSLNIGSMVEFVPGVRYEENNTLYSGAQGNQSASGPLYLEYKSYVVDTASRKNDFLLPMIHLKIKPTRWLMFHLGYTHTLSRPNFTSLIPRMNISAGRNPVVYLNNAKLKPEFARNIDFVTSIHQNVIGLFSINLFRKTISDKIFSTITRPIGDDWEELGLPEALSGYNYTYQYNDTSGVNLNGLELEWQTNFWYLPGVLKGLVLNMNYTHIFSEATYPYAYLDTIIRDPDDPFRQIEVWKDEPYQARLISQPSDILNLSLGYDYKGFSVRISMMYTSDIFKGHGFYKEQTMTTGKFIRFDLNAKQKLPHGMMVFLNLNNINNAMEYTYQKGYDYPTYYESYGMTVDLGLRWNFSSIKNSNTNQ